jgi:hypothetical protein
LSAKVLQFNSRQPAEADVLTELAFEMWLAHCFSAQGSTERDLLEAEQALRMERPGKLLELPKAGVRAIR